MRLIPFLRPTGRRAGVSKWLWGLAAVSIAGTGAGYVVAEVAGIEPAALILPRDFGTHGLLEIDQPAELSDAKALAPQRPWRVRLARLNGNEYLGRLDVLGVEGMQGGALYARVEWMTVHGSVTDDNGATLGEFIGEIHMDGRVAGRFLATDGRTGSWSSKWP